MGAGTLERTHVQIDHTQIEIVGRATACATGDGMELALIDRALNGLASAHAALRELHAYQATEDANHARLVALARGMSEAITRHEEELTVRLDADRAQLRALVHESMADLRQQLAALVGSPARAA